MVANDVYSNLIFCMHIVNWQYVCVKFLVFNDWINNLETSIVQYWIPKVYSYKPHSESDSLNIKSKIICILDSELHYCLLQSPFIHTLTNTTGSSPDHGRVPYSSGKDRNHDMSRRSPILLDILLLTVLM